MSLWSPVDLVSGGKTTTNNSISHNSMNSSHFRSAKREDKKPFAHNYTSSLLYDHLIRRSSSKLSVNSNVYARNSSLPINCVVMSSNDTTATSTLQNIHNSTNINARDFSLFKRSVKNESVKDLINANQLNRVINSSLTEQALPLIKSKSKSSDEVNKKCDNNESIKHKMSNNDEQDASMPLNLCVKKARDERTESTNNINIHKNSNAVPFKSNLAHINSTTLIAPQYNPLSIYKKRGRKPKSLLATTSNLLSASTVVESVFDAKPRKRGRPPTLSPPLCPQSSQSPSVQSVPLAAHTSNLSKVSSCSGAFQQHYPYAVHNTPLQPGWPTVSSTGQLIFPDKLNGSETRNEINSYKHKQNSVSESSDNNESLVSDTASNDDSNCDSDSQTSSGNKTCDSRHIKSHLERAQPDEKEIRIPLEHGWRRETRIRGFSKSGVMGEVIYYAPSGRKLKDFPEVIKYLLKNGISDINQDNFSFNSKIIVGDFLERIHHGDNTELLLSEQEVNARIEEIKRAQLFQSSILSLEKKRKLKNDIMLCEDLHNRDTLSKFLFERTRALIPRDAKRMKYEELRRMKDRENNVKEPEKFVKLEMMRLEKVNKAQQIEEARKKRREELERQRQEELLRKTQERELKRQQVEALREQEMQRRRELLIMADLERERRRQHMMLVRALEAHKKQEERERKKEEILAEKRAIQEKKIQRKRLEFELLKELKKPVDDMMLKDLQTLPTLNRIPGLKLPGKAFADALMVFEFLHNFGETLGFDMESLPTLNTLTLALLNIDDSAEEELLSIIHHLLVCAIEDPGVPTNVVTIMGQKLKDAPITNYNITEVLRMYFLAFDFCIKEDAKQHRVESRMVRLLDRACPFLSLDATQKAEILAFLCNELLCNQAIVKRIEENIESVANLRRDKWIHETELRKWKTVKLKREKKNEQQSDDKKNDIEMERNDDESGESDAEDAPNCPNNISTNESEEEMALSNEEVDKKIDKLNKQCNQMNNKLNKVSNMFRVTSLGQDRYRRRYWVLPNAGGVFVEGIESGEPDEMQNNIWDEKDESEPENENENENEEKQENGKDNDEQNDDNDANCNENVNKFEEEPQLDNDKSTLEINLKNKSDKNSESKESSNIESNDETDCKDDNYKKQTELERKFDAKKVLDAQNNSDMQTALNNESPWISPFFASMLNSLMMNNNSVSPSINSMSSQMPLSMSLGLDFASNGNNVTKANQTQKTWFSVLPRMPCDNKSIDDRIKNEDFNNYRNKKTEKSNESNLTSQQKLLQQSPLSSLMNGLPSNLFMQAFLYPHILSSLFNQHSLGGGPCPPDTSPFSFGSSFSTKDMSALSLNLPTNSESINSENTELNGKSVTNTNECLSDAEFDICPSLQKRIAQQKEQQYEKPKKIAMEYQLGWWRITDSSQLKIMLEVLHTRGVRERQLQKHLTKYLTYASNSCKSNVAELEITNVDRIISETCAYGAPTNARCPHKLCINSDYCKEVALRFDIAVLEQIEALEEKAASSSMQIRNWKPPPRISCNDCIKFSPAASFVSNDFEQCKDVNDSTNNDVNGSDDSNSKLNESHTKSTRNSDSGEINPVLVGRERILALEAVIERRYLKPPLGFKSNTILISTNNESAQTDDFNENAADENATSGLLRWRDAVREAKCSAEIALCLHFLESCIAWDKSIMRASCQFCGSGENEAQLLLCDGCDKGYHTYCFKPKMESIPDGDWFCFECQNKNTIDKVCVVCGKKGKLLNCDSCAKVFHPNCLDPPVTKPLKGKWICHMCGRKPKKPPQQKSSKKSNSSPEEKEAEIVNIVNIVSSCSNVVSTKESTSGRRLANGSAKCEKEGKKEKKSKENKVDLRVCRVILDEMENHEDSWPFLLPVNTKQFPTYKKIIKKPMDTSSIRMKIDSASYKCKEDFAADVRQIFDNCVTFNEDESPVGQAGHTLRAFFEAKWKELCGS